MDDSGLGLAPDDLVADRQFISRTAAAVIDWAHRSLDDRCRLRADTGLHTRTVLDSAARTGTLPGALLRTLVAHYLTLRRSN